MKTKINENRILNQDLGLHGNPDTTFDFGYLQNPPRLEVKLSNK